MSLRFDWSGRYYPRSFLRLLLFSFVAAALPFVLAFVNFVVLVETLFLQSQSAVAQAAEAARGSRILMEHAIDLERIVRQYLVLADRALLGDYESRRKRFQATTSELSHLPLSEEQLRELNGAIELEKRLHQNLVRPGTPSTEDERALLQGFFDLSGLARTVVNASNDLTDHEIERLRSTAGLAQSILWWHLLALVPLGIAICAGLMVLIARPVRQLDQAIRRLGSGEFEDEIRVSGPADLQHLGARLEWLRLRLVELEQQKQLFLRHVSHELKTPLTSLREGSELLADGTAGPLTANQREIVTILADKSRELQRLIEDLLNYHRARQGVARLHLCEARLDEIVRGVVEDQRLAASARDVRFEARLAPVALRADPDKLRAIVDNLVSNAIKHSPDGGVIALELRRTGADVVMEVRDSGPGVPPDLRERVFDWFFSGRQGEATVRGTGLGLAIVREFVHAHRGTIEVMDNSPSGACFRVSLPADPAGALA
ncbi:MAG: HAMP domain-containing histidine kinase [Burkholderiales bacterium]|nr:HAMP domain-containing histidine kinase [Burkholderiales bacterium]